jgi:ribosome maturation factor RimP
VRATNPVEERVIALIEPIAGSLGYRIVRVRLSGQRRKRLQIMAERSADGQMSVEDCSRLSRALSPAFDLEDPIPGEYDLEISSPGIDRPLMTLEDFQRFIGYEAKLETAAMIDGRRRFKGAIAGVEGGVVVLRTQDGDVRLDFSGLSDARLVLTDKLIEEDLKRAKAAEAADIVPPPRAGEVVSETNRRGEATASPSRQPVAPSDSSTASGGANQKRKDT